MARRELEGLRVAALAADGFEQVELTIPLKTLRKHGAAVDVVSLRPGTIRGMNLILPGKKVRVDRLINEANPEVYDALLIPGGFVNPDLLRQSQEALEFVRAFDRAEKPIAVLCHGPWVLASAGLLRGRRLTSWPGIKDDLINAGAEWVDESLVRDRNWVSSRGPQDMKAFLKGMRTLFAEHAPLAPKEMERRQPALLWVLAGLAVAAIGYALRRGGFGEQARQRIEQGIPRSVGGS